MKGVYTLGRRLGGNGDLNIHMVFLTIFPSSYKSGRSVLLLCVREKGAGKSRENGRCSVVDFELPDWSFTILFILSFSLPPLTPPPPQTDLE